MHDVLCAEGLTFDEAGWAAPDQHINVREIAELLGLPIAAELAETEIAGEEILSPQALTTLEQRFLHQLNEQSGPQAADAVQRLLEHWRSRGGELQYGTSAGAFCDQLASVAVFDMVVAALDWFMAKVTASDEQEEG